MPWLLCLYKSLVFSVQCSPLFMLMLYIFYVLFSIYFLQGTFYIWRASPTIWNKIKACLPVNGLLGNVSAFVSGCWWTTDRRLPSAPLRRTLPDPLQTQSPASSLPCPSMTKRQDPPQTRGPSLLQCQCQRQCLSQSSPRSRKSDQVRKPATSSIPVRILVECEDMEWSSTHTPATEGELHMDSGKRYE